MAYFLRYKAGNNKELLTKNTEDPIAKAANGHEYVDLGLPSGTLWAKCNVGAENETDSGLYFLWGDTQGYNPKQFEGKIFDLPDYKWVNFETGLFTKYNSTDGKTVLDLEDDAAHINMGGKWRMPTSEEFIELLNETRWERVTDYNNELGIRGILFHSKINSNTMFMPDVATIMGDIIQPELKYMFCSDRGHPEIEGPESWAWQYDTEDIVPFLRMFGTCIRGVLKIN